MNPTALLMLGQRIQHYRKLANLTQEQLAEKVGINANTVSKMERGDACPRLETFLNICNAVQASPNQLLKDLAPDDDRTPEEFLFQQICQLPNYKQKELLKSIIEIL